MNNPTELPDLDKLEALAKAATPGPWSRHDSHGKVYIEPLGDNEPVASITKTNCAANAGFIAAANPAAVLALIATVRRNERILMATCADLGLVNEALGLDPDDGGADPILAAIEELKQARRAKPDGEALQAEAYDQFVALRKILKTPGYCDGTKYTEREAFDIAVAARRAQPEGEAPQAEPVMWFEAEPSARGREAKDVIGSMLYSTRIHTLKAPFTSNPVWPLYAHPPAATLSPLCGAQHAESGKEVAAKPPFPISDDEMAALRRFWECATDGEGYDVEKSMMQRLAEIGLVQRKSGAYYMATDFGLYVLGEYTVQRAAQLDGGQEGSGSNG